MLRSGKTHANRSSTIGSQRGPSTDLNRPHFCPYMSGHLLMTYNGMISYCRPHSLKKASGLEDFSWPEFLEKRKANIQALIKGDLDICTDCTFLKRGMPPEGEYEFHYLHLNFSAFCNLRCVYCYISAPLLSQKETKAEKRGLEFIRQLLDAERFDPHGWVTFSGGEPTITSVFGKVCELLSQYSPHISYNFITNGTVLSQSILMLLKSPARVNVGISIDAANKDLYAAIKGKDCFDRVIWNLEKYIDTANRYDNNNFGIKCILLPENIGHIDAFLAMLSRLGVKRALYDIDARYRKDKQVLPMLIEGAAKFHVEAERCGLAPSAEYTGLSTKRLQTMVKNAVEGYR